MSVERLSQFRRVIQRTRTCEVIDAILDSTCHVENGFHAVPKFTPVQYFGSHGSHDLVVMLKQQVK